MTNAPFFFGDTGGSDHSDLHHNQVSSSSYPSPLSEILHDLKRKHVVAATAASTSTGSTVSFGNTTTDQDSNIPMTMNHTWNASTKHSTNSTTTTTTTIPSERRRNDRGDRSPQHAKALLRRTPHLRHLSTASTDMQATYIQNNKPLLLPTFLRTESSQPSPTLVDYRTCIVREASHRQAARELTAFVTTLAHEMSLDLFGQVEAALFTKLFTLVHLPHTRLAGILALDALMDAPSANEEKKAIKFANNLSNALRATPGDYEFWASVSAALGHMAMKETNIDFVESEIVRALEWIRTDRSDRRLAATLTLKALALHAPTAFHSKTNLSTGSNEFLDHIGPVLSDIQPIVRVCAADALSQCLKILLDRNPPGVTALRCQVYFRILEGLDQKLETNHKKPSHTQMIQMEARCHGSLLMIASMLEYTRDFMLPRFDETCEAILELTNHPKALIRLEIIRLIPRLARRCPGAFGRRYLETCLNFLMNSAANPTPPRVGVDIRPSAFCAIGNLMSICDMSWKE